MQELILATHNGHKTREVQRILGKEFTVRDLISHPEIPEAIETGDSFEQNAVIKAMAAAQYLPDLVVADDSGLEVDALSGAPGIYSARYAGEKATDQDNVKKLLRDLAAAEKEGGGARTARFRCVIAVVKGGRVLKTFEGAVRGAIVAAPRGAGGFGYDPIFKPVGFELTFGELDAAEKDQISHRGAALAKLRAWLCQPAD